LVIPLIKAYHRFFRADFSLYTALQASFIDDSPAHPDLTIISHWQGSHEFSAISCDGNGGIS
jgi:hypothetical protein